MGFKLTFHADIGAMGLFAADPPEGLYLVTCVKADEEQTKCQIRLMLRIDDVGTATGVEIMKVISMPHAGADPDKNKTYERLLKRALEAFGAQGAGSYSGEAEIGASFFLNKKAKLHFIPRDTSSPNNFPTINLLVGDEYDKVKAGSLKIAGAPSKAAPGPAGAPNLNPGAATAGPAGAPAFNVAQAPAGPAPTGPATNTAGNPAAAAVLNLMG